MWQTAQSSLKHLLAFAQSRRASISASHTLTPLAITAAIALVYIDWITWLQVNISIIYSIPLVLASIGRDRRLLWALLVSLLCATFAVYAFQIGHGFSWNEQYFVNRLLASATMLVTTVLLDGWTRALDNLDERDRERRRAEQAVRENEGRLRAVYDGTYDYIGLLAPDGTLLDTNRASLQFAGDAFGNKREDVVGRPFWETVWFMHTPGAPERMQEAVALAAKGEVIRYEAPLRRPSGEEVVFDFSIHPIKDDKGEVALIVPEGRVITDRIRAEQALRKSEAQLRVAHRHKDEFLAMLAHELRNHLAAISNSTELLLRTPPKDTGLQTALAVIRRQLTLLTRLLDDLLDVSRISEGRIQLRKQPSDADTIISHAIETVDSRLREKHQTLSVMTAGHEPLHVNVDFARLVQCVSNLLINAVKYTDPGGKISVRTHSDDTNFFIEVADSGSGIASEMLPHVFDLFVQSERTLDRAQGGLGIGLAVVKRLIEMHGGDVNARSDGVGCGSTFTLRLPRAVDPSEQVRIEAVCKAEPQRVLIVDDNVDATTSLSMLLELQGHAIRAAYSAKEALAQAEAFRPDAALLDIGLPDMDGYELARRLRALPTLYGLRLIALTGHGQPDDSQRALSAGFQCHIVKPADSSALDRALSNATTGTPVRH